MSPFEFFLVDSFGLHFDEFTAYLLKFSQVFVQRVSLNLDLGVLYENSKILQRLFKPDVW